MIPITVSVGPLVTAAANNIALSQTPLGAGYLTLNGALVVAGVATLDTPRRILLTTNGNEVGINFTVLGTNWAGDIITEVMAGVSSSTVTSVLDYKTITSIAVSAATAAAVTYGTTTTAGSQWVRFDSWANSYISIQATKSGTINYTLQQTMDDPNSPTNPVTPVNVTWVSSSDTAAVGATGSIQSNYGFAPTWARVLLNSGTGSVSVTYAQSGVVSR